MGREHDLAGDASARRTMDRRTLIKGAAVAGAAAWTAPVLIDSVLSPAAAASCNGVTYVGADSVATGTNVKYLDVSVPAVAAGDLIVVVGTWNDNSGIDFQSPTTGFSKVTATGTSGQIPGLGIVQGTATATNTPSTVRIQDSLASGGGSRFSRFAGCAFVYRCAKSGITAAATSTTGAQATWTPPSITTTVDNAWAFCAVGTSDDNSLTQSALSGWTNILAGTNVGNNLSFIVSHRGPVSPAGSVNMPQFNQTARGNDPWASCRFAINP